MGILAGIENRIGALVVPEVRARQVEFLQHKIFIGFSLVLSLLAFMAVPPYLAFAGRPGAVDALVFAWALLPLLAVWIVSRTGNLIRGHIVCIAATLGVSATLALGAPSVSIAAVAWLALAPVEAFVTGSAMLVLATGGAALAVAIVIAALKFAGVAAASAGVSEIVSVMMAMLAIVYATGMGLGALYVQYRERKRAGIGHSRYLSLSEVIGDIVLRLDRSGAVLHVSKGIEEQFALHPRDLMGRGLFERVHVADRPAFLKTVSDAAASNGTATHILRIRLPDRCEDEPEVAPWFAWVEIRAHRINLETEDPCDPDGAAVVALLRDVSIMKQHQQELERARLEAEQANYWKDRFLANVSHELRTPLNAIIGFSEILANENIGPSDPVKRREYAAIIGQSGHHLLSVVNLLLDMSKIEAGSFDVLPEPFEIRPLVEQCCDMISLKAGEGSIDLHRDLANAPHEIVADRRAMKQIVLNLLSNAVKFTPENGKVSISVQAEANYVRIVVADTGIGMNPQDLEQIGSPFFQARTDLDRPFEGTGLGLSVVRGLVGLHGGTIQIESEPGAGTRVTVRLPLHCTVGSGGRAASAPIETVPYVHALPGGMVEQDTGVKKIA